MRFVTRYTNVLSMDARFIIGLTLVSLVLGLIALFISYEMHARPIWEFFAFAMVSVMSYKYLGLAGMLLRKRWTGSIQ